MRLSDEKVQRTKRILFGGEAGKEFVPVLKVFPNCNAAMPRSPRKRADAYAKLSHSLNWIGLSPH